MRRRKRILGAAILGVGGDEVIHSILDVMYAKAPYTVIQRAVHIHPTVSELIPTMLGELEASGVRARPSIKAVRALVVSGETADPDVAVADRLGVVLQAQRLLGGVRSVFGDLAPDGGAELLLVILHQHAVEEHGEIGGLDQLSILQNAAPRT